MHMGLYVGYVCCFSFLSSTFRNSFISINRMAVSFNEFWILGGAWLVCCFSDRCMCVLVAMFVEL